MDRAYEDIFAAMIRGNEVESFLVIDRDLKHHFSASN